MWAEYASANPDISPEYGALLDRIEECLNEQGPYLSMTNPETGTEWESRARVVEIGNEHGQVRELNGSLLMLTPQKAEPRAGLDIDLGYAVTLHGPNMQANYDYRPTAGYSRRPGIEDAPLTTAQYENMLFLLDHSRPVTLTEAGQIAKAMSDEGLQIRTKGMHEARFIIGLANGESLVV